ncbi:hypothetical protein KCP70_06695 [Salmonella enterica subsp. enterica]|nr:hypothetical protein KCP70_06695 [Salmonella enterica subsp. enterica]
MRHHAADPVNHRYASITEGTREEVRLPHPFLKFRLKRRCQSTKHGYHSQILTASPPQAAGYPTLQPAVFSTNWQSMRLWQPTGWILCCCRIFAWRAVAKSAAHRGAARLRQTPLTALPAHPALPAVIHVADIKPWLGSLSGWSPAHSADDSTAGREVARGAEGMKEPEGEARLPLAIAVQSAAGCRVRHQKGEKQRQCAPSTEGGKLSIRAAAC